MYFTPGHGEMSQDTMRSTSPQSTMWSTSRMTVPMRTDRYMASTTSWMTQDSRMNTMRLTGHGGIEGKTDQSFPGKPNTSAGLKSGTHTQWSFERLPSLLPHRLDRDFGTSGNPFGRGVAGPTNDASICQGKIYDTGSLLEGFPRGTTLPWMVTPHTWTSFQGGIRPPSQGGTFQGGTMRSGSRGLVESPHGALRRSMSDTHMSMGALAQGSRAPGDQTPAATQAYGRLGVPQTTESNGLDLHAVINTSWDDAGIAAGQCYPGADGRWVGF